MPLFEVAVIGKQKTTLPETEIVLIQPVAVCAKDAEAAKTRVTLDFANQINKAIAKDIQVLARPFV